MMIDCAFCKIAAEELSVKKLYDNGTILAFQDINPKAPIHILIIPRKHIATLNDLASEDAGLIGQIYLAGKQLASDLGVANSGYRTVINCNRDANQVIFHIHMHLLAGRKFSWPPG